MSGLSLWSNETSLEGRWSDVEKQALVAVLGLEMVMGVAGNCLVLLVKIKVCVDQFSSLYWVPFLSLTLSDLGSSLFIISGSLLAVVSKGQVSPWCEIVSMLKFAFITSSIGSIESQRIRLLGVSCTRGILFLLASTACIASWVTGVVVGSVPVIYNWIRYDPSEMLCAVFWESSYSDMLVYILTAFSVCIFAPLLLIVICSLLTSAGCQESSRSGLKEDLSSVTLLLVLVYTFCYTPFALSELILLGRLDLSPSPGWLRTLSSVMSYMDCGLNPIIYCANQDFRQAGLALLWTRRKPVSEPVLTHIAILAT
ncbi:uncharacterized protein FYW47_002748 [Aplochiton taeniatus]